ncbi:MAG: carboxypeptidase-like regulatory domain-containing protein [Bacteroidales bacterium]|jgi:hypothetical protein|nr:carboxypeptidase-like regulatory domain-containing protein [Bacteroidales bacterium]
MKWRCAIISLLIFFSSVKIFSQNVDENLVQFSGVILTSDSLNPVPFAHIIIVESDSDKIKGTSADYYGFFSFVAQKSDTIQFTAVGYKPVTFIIPDTITEKRYSLIQLMTSDTIYLGESVIYPWPTWEEFKEVFVNLDIPDDEITIAMKNIELAKLKEAASSRINRDPDARVNYRHYVNNVTNKLYTAGGIPTSNLGNPFAWAKFIKAWKEGKFKRDKQLIEEINRQKETDAKRWDYDEWIEKE